MHVCHSVQVGIANEKRHKKSCQSAHESTFSGEICTHFRGLEGLDKPIVWLFPTVQVCINRGFADCTVPENGIERAYA
jgi:hypothetical protein